MSTYRVADRANPLADEIKAQQAAWVAAGNTIVTHPIRINGVSIASPDAASMAVSRARSHKAPKTVLTARENRRLISLDNGKYFRG